MIEVEGVSQWIQNVFKTSRNYSNKFYYDGNGVICNYEKATQMSKECINIINDKKKTLKKIHEKRLEKPSIFTHLYRDINYLESVNLELELQMAINESMRNRDTLIILKNLVGLSKITHTLMDELPQNEITRKKIENFRQFQLSSEPSIDMIKTFADEQLKKQDKDNLKDR